VSKIDEMRRQREAQDARRKTDERAAKPARASSSGEAGSAKVVPLRRPAGNDNAAVEAPSETAAATAAPATAEARSSAKSRGGDETGKCASCGKVKALSGGLVTQHQKGLGKMCPGSRKAPS
jgi:hypothetical protein